MLSRDAYYKIFEFLLYQYFSYYNNIHKCFPLCLEASPVQGLTKCFQFGYYFEQSVYFIINGIIIFCCELEGSQTGSVSLSNVKRDR